MIADCQFTYLISCVVSARGYFTPLGVEDKREEVKRQKEKGKITKIAAVAFGSFAMTSYVAFLPKVSMSIIQSRRHEVIKK